METWKPITNFKNVANHLYEVSDKGNVRTVSCRLLHKKIANRKKHPYYAVNLVTTDGGKTQWVLVHQLVAHAFIPIPERYNDTDDLVPDHLDNNGLNNNVSNLEWKTRGENVKSAFEAGYINNSCDAHSGAIVTNDQVESICRYLSEQKTYDEIIELMGFPNTDQYRHLLVRIKNRIAWKKISSKYDFSSTTMYTKSQQDTLSHLDEILKLIKLGKSDIEIAKKIWGDNCNVGAKSAVVYGIRTGKSYKNILCGSTTIES